MANETKVVKCPESFAPLFAQAEQIMQGFFSDLERTPERGQIHIQGVRYMLMRTDSMSIELQEELRKTFGETGARQIRYKLGKACGIRDAKLFAERLKVEDPAMRLALGPVHFAHVGWANVDIFDESAPQPNEDYFLVYDHPYSFEAASYVDNDIVSDHPVCHMNAGYSTGWCQVSFGIDLKAEELTCRAKGDDQCIFVMAHPRNFERLRDEFARARGLS
jgi:predicted hydrocarbon binding protein